MWVLLGDDTIMIIIFHFDFWEILIFGNEFGEACKDEGFYTHTVCIGDGSVHTGLLVRSHAIKAGERNRLSLISLHYFLSLEYTYI